MSSVVAALQTVLEEALVNPVGPPHQAMLAPACNNAGAAFRSAYFLMVGFHDTGKVELREAAEELFAQVDAATFVSFAEGAADKLEHFWTDPLPDPSGKTSIYAIYDDALAKLTLAGATRAATALTAVRSKPIPACATVAEQVKDVVRATGDELGERQDSWQRFFTGLTAIWGGAVSVVAVLTFTVTLVAVLVFAYVVLRKYVPTDLIPRTP